MEGIMITTPYNKDAIAKTMPERLRFFRHKNNMSIYQVAERLNKSAATISLWENGKALPDIDTLLKICNMYGITDINELISYYIPPTLKSLTKTELKLITMYRTSSKRVKHAILVLLETINPEPVL